MIGGEFRGAPTQGDPWTTQHTVTSDPANAQFTKMKRPEITNLFRFYRYVGGKGSHGDTAEVEFYAAGALLLRLASAGKLRDYRGVPIDAAAFAKQNRASSCLSK